MIGPLTVEEQLELEMLEEVLAKGRKAAGEVLDVLDSLPAQRLELATQFFQALQQIREKKLYRPLSFDAYCKQPKIGVNASRVRQYALHLECLRALKALGVTTVTDLPDLNERQTRELTRAGDAEAQLSILKALIAEGGEITADRIRELVNQLKDASPAEKLEFVQNVEANAMREQDRQIYGQILRLVRRARDLAGQLQDPDEIAPTVEEWIDAVCDKGNLDRPDLSDKKHRRVAA